MEAFNMTVRRATASDAEDIASLAAYDPLRHGGEVMATGLVRKEIL
jgi:hypothetical protein